MARASKLTLAFVSQRPASAARVLESLPVDDAAAFIDSIPTRYALDILMALHTMLSADIVQRLPLASATAVLREMEFTYASAVLRRMPRETRLAILAEFPDRRRRDIETAMQFAADTVGAKMSTAVVTASSDETVAVALKRVKEDRDGQSDVVFVIDDQHKLIGSIRLSLLARQSGKTLLSNLLDNSCAPVAARARVAQVKALAAWRQYNQLPVVSRRGELIGAIYKAAIVEDTHGGERNSTAENPAIAGSLLQMIIDGAPGLSDLLTTQSRRPAATGESNGR